MDVLIIQLLDEYQAFLFMVASCQVDDVDVDVVCLGDAEKAVIDLFKNLQR